ncbi:hypothetical protein K7432_007769 [Basidiobolus ranarum]|uniref:Ankyrin repeat protein n=1 Tax=Basidiobolus ranarum TaxID=34480 RepID=A0ABR2WST9_9FUNG
MKRKANVELSTKNKKQSLKQLVSLNDLPIEILSYIFILSESCDLPLVSRRCYWVTTSQDYIKASWLLQKYGPNVIHAFQAGIRYRFFNQTVLSYLDQAYRKCNLKSTETSESNTPLENITIPKRFFLEMEQSKSSLSFVRTFLERGASPNNPSGFPVIKSAQIAHIEMLDLLAEFQADLGVKDNMALSLSANRGHFEVVKKLLDLGVKPDSNALRFAVKKRHWNVVKLLMDNGAVPDMETLNLL